MHPTQVRQYLTNEQVLRYKYMPDTVYAKTLKSGILSKQGNKYGQAYCNNYGWSRFYPMAYKSEANDTLSLMFKCDVIPPKMIVYKSKGKSLGLFAHKCR